MLSNSDKRRIEGLICVTMPETEISAVIRTSRDYNKKSLLLWLAHNLQYEDRVLELLTRDVTGTIVEAIDLVQQREWVAYATEWYKTLREQETAVQEAVGTLPDCGLYEVDRVWIANWVFEETLTDKQNPEDWADVDVGDTLDWLLRNPAAAAEVIHTVYGEGKGLDKALSSVQGRMRAKYANALIEYWAERNE